MTRDYDEEIAEFLTGEILYKCQYFLFLISIMFGILFRFIGIDGSFWLLLYFIWAIINILLFWAYMNRIYLYVAKTDHIVAKKLEDRAENIF